MHLHKRLKLGGRPRVRSPYGPHDAEVPEEDSEAAIRLGRLAGLLGLSCGASSDA